MRSKTFRGSFLCALAPRPSVPIESPAVTGHALSPRGSHAISRQVSQIAAGRAIAARASRRRIRNALRAVFAFECPRPPLRDSTIEMEEKKAQSKEPSGADERAGGFRSADFSGASPVASALGIRAPSGQGRDPISVNLIKCIAWPFPVRFRQLFCNFFPIPEGLGQTVGR